MAAKLQEKGLEICSDVQALESEPLSRGNLVDGVNSMGFLMGILMDGWELS